jgi:hypothetical protein
VQSLVLEQVDSAGEGGGALVTREHLRGWPDGRSADGAARGGAGRERRQHALRVDRVEREVRDQLVPTREKHGRAQVAAVEIGGVGRRVGAQRDVAVARVALRQQARVHVRAQVVPLQTELPLVRAAAHVAVVHLPPQKRILQFETKSGIEVSFNCVCALFLKVTDFSQTKTSL